MLCARDGRVHTCTLGSIVELCQMWHVHFIGVPKNLSPPPYCSLHGFSLWPHLWNSVLSISFERNPTLQSQTYLKPASFIWFHFKSVEKPHILMIFMQMQNPPCVTWNNVWEHESFDGCGSGSTFCIETQHSGEWRLYSTPVCSSVTIDPFLSLALMGVNCAFQGEAKSLILANSISPSLLWASNSFSTNVK